MRFFMTGICFRPASIAIVMLMPALVPSRLHAQKQDTTNATAPGEVVELPTTETPRQYQFAKGLWNRGLYKMAAREFQAFLDSDPKKQYADRANYYYVRSLFRMRQYEEAIKAIDQIRNAQPDYSYKGRLTLMAGEIRLKQDKPAAARREFETLQSHENPTIAEPALYFLAETYVQQNMRPHATAIYTRLASREFAEDRPYRAHAAFALAGIYREIEQLDKAEKQYQRLAQNTSTPPSLRTEALYNYAELVSAQGKYEKAAEAYVEIGAQDTENRIHKRARLGEMRARLKANQSARVIELAQSWKTKYGDSDLGQVNYLHGLALLNTKNYRQAAELFRRILQKYSESPYARPARYQLCHALLQNEQYEAAGESCKDFLKHYPNADQTPDVQYFAALAASAQDKYEMAGIYAQQALESTQNTAWKYKAAARQLLADAYNATGKPLKAAEIFVELTDNTDGKNRISYRLQAADLYVAGKRPNKAAALYKQICEDQAANTDQATYAAMKCARLYLAGNQPEKAARFLDTALKNDRVKNEPRLLFMLGLAQYRTGDFQAAADVLEKILSEDTTPAALRPDARYMLTACLLELGHVEKALQTFAQVIKTDRQSLHKFDDQLLLKLTDLYYERNKYGLTKILCRDLTKSENADIAYDSTLKLGQVYIAENALNQAVTLLQNFQAGKTKNQPPEASATHSELSALLGEAYLLQGRNDQAVRAFRKSLANGDLADSYLARAQWGLAHILASEERYKEALRHAMNGFIMANDKIYTPKAMWLAVKILVELDRSEEAAVTWEEFRRRFPAAAAQHADSDLIKNDEF